jgi:hypothetical protein
MYIQICARSCGCLFIDLFVAGEVNVGLGEAHLAAGGCGPAGLDGGGHGGDEVHLAGHQVAQVQHVHGLAALQLDGRGVGEGGGGQAELLGPAQQQVGAQFDDVHYGQEEQTEALGVPRLGQRHQQLLRAHQDDVIVRGLDDREAHRALEHVGLEGEHLLISVDQRVAAQARQLAGLGSELVRDQLLHVLHVRQLHQHRHHQAVPLGGGGALQVEGVGQDGAQQHARGLARGAAVHGEEGVRDDGAHGAPGADVDVDGHVRDDGGVLQGVVVDDSHNALRLCQVRSGVWTKWVGLNT